MKFIKSNSIKIELENEQWDMVCKPEVIENAIKNENVIAFDILNSTDKLIGFTMLRKFEKNSYFLWEFAIDKKFQDKGYGKKSLVELIDFLKEKYNLKILTTTYIYGNEKAKKLYENIGFIETEIIEEDGIHEVDMLLKI